LKIFPAFPVLIALAMTACTSVAAPPADPVRNNPDGVGIDGYSPVSYFTEGHPERGDPSFSSEYEGVTYYFTNAGQVDLFRNDPARYLPAHGGWCTLMMGGSGRRTPGHPESFVIIDDRLMLFWSGDTEQTRGMGLMNWGRKTNGVPDEEREYIARADKQWDSFLSGKRKSRIYLYKPSDAESISEAQKTDAKVEF
jgi:YHS domain-containing protein